MGVERINARFKALKAEGRAAFIPFITAGDPDLETSSALLAKLAESGADLIELGLPFSDPMADGPSVQAASIRALKAGASARATLDMVRQFRKTNTETPIIVMGYFNPIHAYGPEAFAKDCAEAGIDGLIIVDLPYEEDWEFKPHADAAGLALIRLVAPTTDDRRLPATLAGISGFVYFVSITGVTGTKGIDVGSVAGHLTRVRKASDLPVAVGFGIKTPEDAAAVAKIADASVVGSAIVDQVKAQLDADGKALPGLVDGVCTFAQSLASAVRGVSKT